MPEYSITLDDVQAYLAWKRDDEVIGVTCDPCGCLLTETLTCKYPGLAFSVTATVFSVNFDEIYEHTLSQVVSDFDQIGVDRHGLRHKRAVTKRQWLDSTLRTEVLDA